MQETIQRLTSLSADELSNERSAALDTFAKLRRMLNSGEIRAAEPDSSAASGWKVNTWVKQGILLGFKLGVLHKVESNQPWYFSDKDTLPTRHFNDADAVRIVPGGSTVRDERSVAYRRTSRHNTDSIVIVEMPRRQCIFIGEVPRLV